MRKIVYLIFAAVLSASVWSCRQTAEGNTESADTLVEVFRSPDLTYAGLIDSVKDVLVRHSAAELVNDSLVIDASAAQYVITQTFDENGFLSGNAMRIYTDEYPNGQAYNVFRFTFDENGDLVDARPSLKAFTIERNDAGYLTLFNYESTEDPSTNYKKVLTWNDNGQLVGQNYTGEGESSEEDYAYNDRGLVSKIISIDTFGDVKEESEKTYNYTHFDKRNNWIRREIVTSVKSTEVGQEPTSHTDYAVETRSIKYY